MRPSRIRKAERKQRAKREEQRRFAQAPPAYKTQRRLTNFEIETMAFGEIQLSRGNIDATSKRIFARMEGARERIIKSLKGIRIDHSGNTLYAYFLSEARRSMDIAQREILFIEKLLAEFKKDKGVFKRFIAKHLIEEIRSTQKHSPANPEATIGSFLWLNNMSPTRQQIQERIEINRNEISRIREFFTLAANTGVKIPQRSQSSIESLINSLKIEIGLFKKISGMTEGEKKRLVGLFIKSTKK